MFNNDSFGSIKDALVKRFFNTSIEKNILPPPEGNILLDNDAEYLADNSFVPLADNVV